jgi:hypothetical protein
MYGYAPRVRRILWSVIAVALLVPASRLQAQGWLDPSWSYRVPVTIGNAGGTPLTNFQAHVVLNSTFNFGAAQTTGADLRVTAGDGTSPIPFWIETWNSGSSASIWFRVPSIPAGGTTIYLYYGNPAAVSASNGTATFTFFDNFSASPLPLSSFNNKAISWLMRAQDATGSGGVSFYYILASQSYQPSGYPEVTGYIIPTFYDTAAATTDPNLGSNLRIRAKAMADWEVSIQGSDGSWSFVFDTGQIIEGLVRAFQETGNVSYLNAAKSGGNWLISKQATNGSWPSDFGGFAKPYQARVARALLLLWQAAGTASYLNAATKNLDWDVSQQHANGWFNNLGINSTSENVSPLTHTIAYTMEGLLDSGIILNNSIYINAAKKTADALLAQQLANGSLSGGTYLSNWTPGTAQECLTGDAQTALVWLKLYQYTVNQGSADPRYLNAAHSLNQYLVGAQGNSTNTGIDGGLAGSDPVNGFYEGSLILSWATKFFVDDLNLETKLVTNDTLQFPFLDSNKWSFPAGPGGFAHYNAALQYNGPSSGAGPRALAMSGGSPLAFGDGIVEYNLQANGGYDELGLVYRGQNPETANSYVFYQSIWNAQNDWLLYGTASNNAFNLGTGGSFTPGTWYAIKAAISGSSHAFSINGSQIFTSSDFTFPSGTVGLFAWGNAIASVSNFRIRQYAATEPSAVVGAQQSSGPGVTSVTLNPTSIAGGNPVTGTVTLNNTTGGTVALSSSNTSVATVPASVPVAGGSSTATFPVNTVAVTTATSVSITATFAGTMRQATLLVTPSVSSVALNPNSVVGGNNPIGTVSLTGAAPAGGAVVALMSSNTAVATVPATATVSASATSANFLVTTSGVAASTGVTITAGYNGSSQPATLTVTPASLSSVALNPTSVVGGSPATGTVTLNGASPPGSGAVVGLSSSNTSAATVPPTVTINAGASQANFPVTTKTVSSSTASTISASYQGGNASATLTVVSSSWLGTGWAYRRPVTVSNATGSTLTNFQVHVVLDSSFSFANAQSNGGDIRFTTSDGVTQIPFWIESWTAGSSASLWALAPSIPSTGTTLFMYYGNPSVTTAANGNSTFNFFDDFSYRSGGSPAIDPTKWSFPAGQTGFTNSGGTLQYNGPAAGFGPRASAMSGGSNIVFTNGIVEYNLQGNGGYDELGLMYRGQNPETANSYVFYQSTWTAENDWQLYKRVQNSEVNVSSGGSFTPGVWYAIKAAVGGSSHTFSINGTGIFAATDSTYSSGTVGLFAWGNAVASVTNFRIRQYAATEPATAVGGEQLPH